MKTAWVLLGIAQRSSRRQARGCARAWPLTSARARRRASARLFRVQLVIRSTRTSRQNQHPSEASESASAALRPPRRSCQAARCFRAGKRTPPRHARRCRRRRLRDGAGSAPRCARRASRRPASSLSPLHANLRSELGNGAYEEARTQCLRLCPLHSLAPRARAPSLPLSRMSDHPLDSASPSHCLPAASSLLCLLPRSLTHTSAHIHTMPLCLCLSMFMSISMPMSTSMSLSQSPPLSLHLSLIPSVRCLFAGASVRASVSTSPSLSLSEFLTAPLLTASQPHFSASRAPSLALLLHSHNSSPLPSPFLPLPSSPSLSLSLAPSPSLFLPLPAAFPAPSRSNSLSRPPASLFHQLFHIPICSSIHPSIPYTLHPSPSPSPARAASVLLRGYVPASVRACVRACARACARACVRACVRACNRFSARVVRVSLRGSHSLSRKYLFALLYVRHLAVLLRVYLLALRYAEVPARQFSRTDVAFISECFTTSSTPEARAPFVAISPSVRSALKTAPLAPLPTSFGDESLTSPHVN
eukprot:6214275-Pleurochrysis_carterae.AAC.6